MSMDKQRKQKTKKAVDNMKAKPEMTWKITKDEKGYHWTKTKRTK